MDIQSTKKPTPLAVVLATNDRETLLNATLASLSRCSRPSGYLGTWIVGNGEGARGRAPLSTGASADIHWTFHEVAHKGLALNSVLSSLPEGLLVFLDDDVEVNESLLVAYAEAVEKHPEGCFFGGAIEARDEKEPDPRLIPFLPSSAKGLQYSDSLPKVDRFFVGMNWAVFKRDLVAIGGFDERFGPGALSRATGQESYAQRRLFKHGLKAVFVPQARVKHFVPASRCDLNWVEQRKFREGTEKGILAEEAGQGWPWILWLLLKSLRQQMLGKLRLVFGRQSALRHLLAAHYLRGQRHGWKWNREWRLKQQCAQKTAQLPGK